MINKIKKKLFLFNLVKFILLEAFWIIIDSKILLLIGHRKMVN
jgi:hypothetical protein